MLRITCVLDASSARMDQGRDLGSFVQSDLLLCFPGEIRFCADGHELVIVDAPLLGFVRQILRAFELLRNGSSEVLVDDFYGTYDLKVSMDRGKLRLVEEDAEADIEIAAHQFREAAQVWLAETLEQLETAHPRLLDNCAYVAVKTELAELIDWT